MLKNIIISVLSLILIILIIITFIDRNNSVPIFNEETAIEIGKAVLNEKFPRGNRDYNDYKFEVLDEKGYWHVNIDEEGNYKENEGFYSFRNGGGFWIKIRKKDGKIMNFRIDD